jgi:phosphoribosylaminoimidazole (AIR) synthetase
LGKVPQAELYRALNMGVGVIMVLSPKSALEARCVLPELLTIGTIVEGEGEEKVFMNIQGCEVASDDTNT